MPLCVLPAQIPEISALYDVYFAAFKGEKILDILYPHGIDREAHTNAMKEWWSHDPDTYNIKCVDSNTGEIIGMAVWEVRWKLDATWTKPSGTPWLEGEHRTRAEAVLKPLWDMREKLFGKKAHVCKCWDYWMRRHKADAR